MFSNGSQQERGCFRERVRKAKVSGKACLGFDCCWKAGKGKACLVPGCRSELREHPIPDPRLPGQEAAPVTQALCGPELDGELRANNPNNWALAHMAISKIYLWHSPVPSLYTVSVLTHALPVGLPVFLRKLAWAPCAE